MRNIDRKKYSWSVVEEEKEEGSTLFLSVEKNLLEMKGKMGDS